jgi:hypothetical protein
MSKSNTSSETRHKAGNVATKRREGHSSKNVRYLERSSKRFAPAMKALAKR